MFRNGTNVEEVEYDGIIWRRYPDAKNTSDRKYYKSAGFKEDPKYLHRYKWEKVNGPVPKGCHIHHIDKNNLNNDIENLQAITFKEHRKEHWNEERSEKHKEILRSINHLAKAWHKSEEGSEWHKEHARIVAEAQSKIKCNLICEQCGKEFETPGQCKKHTRFCSNACKSESRRRSGIDNEDRICKNCNKSFTINRYARKEFCSRKCSNENRKEDNSRCI